MKSKLVIPVTVLAVALMLGNGCALRNWKNNRAAYVAPPATTEKKAPEPEPVVKKPVTSKPPTTRPRTPRPATTNNYNGSRAGLMGLLMTGDPKAAWALGEKAQNKIEKYKWWTLATLISQTKNQGPYRAQEAARLKASITSPADRQDFGNWQRRIFPTMNAGKGLRAWLKELQSKNLLPR